jgi:outer membrane protein TolC
MPKATGVFLSFLLYVSLLVTPVLSGEPFWRRWTSPPLPPWRPLTNSPRLAQVIRGGNLYLSLDDAIALAIENNLDVQIQRNNLFIAQTELERARGGGITRGLDYTLAEAPAGVGGPVTTLQTATQRTIPGSSVSTNPLETGALGRIQSNLNLLGNIPLSTGTSIPQFDPIASMRTNWLHQTTTQTSPLLSGLPTLVAETYSAGFAYQQGFGPGTQLFTAFDNTRVNSNSLRSNYNPYTTAAISLTVTQPLLRGFGIKVNRRYQQIAANELRISDLLFRQQLINTVYGVTRLYADFEALYEDVRVKEQIYAEAQKLLADTAAQVEEGTLASVELSRAKAQVFSTKFDLEKARGQLEEQEAILKTVLTRRGNADPEVRAASIIPVTPLRESELPSQSEEELLKLALENRPDIQQATLQLLNADLSIEGVKSAVRPQLDLVLSAQNSGLAGQLNPLVANPDPTFAGGYSTALSQILRRNYPTYSAGIQLALPLHNRVAQADLARDEWIRRQIEVRLQQLQTQARLEVEDALISLRRARSAYEAAKQARRYQEESLEAEQAKFEAGASTSYFLIQAQSALAQARSTEVAARAALAKARTALDRATSKILEANHISIEEARKNPM